MSGLPADARKLVELGKERGVLTLDEVNDALGEIDPARIEEVFDALDRAGVLIEDAVRSRKVDPNEVPPEGTVPIEELMEMEGEPLKESLQQWYDVIGRTPLLGPEQERALALLAREGNTRARYALVESNLRLVVRIARRYAGRGLSQQDVIQSGNLGLIRAAERYDPAKGYGFAQYASWWIRQAIARAISDQRTIRLPGAVTDEVRKLARATAVLQQKLGRDPTQEELAKEMGISEKRLKELMMIAPEPISIEAPLGDDASLADFLEDVESAEAEEEATRQDLRQKIDNLMEDLDDIARRVVRLRFGLEDGLPRTISEIGNELGFSEGEVREIEKQALIRLRAPGVAGFEDAFN